MNSPLNDLEQAPEARGAGEVEADFRAAAVAHAIRLGKRPRSGMVMSGKAQLKTIDEADFAAGRLERAKAESELVEVEFEVTQADIDRAIRLINEQRAVYNEPKTTKVRL